MRVVVGEKIRLRRGTETSKVFLIVPHGGQTVFHMVMGHQTALIKKEFKFFIYKRASLKKTTKILRLEIEIHHDGLLSSLKKGLPKCCADTRCSNSSFSPMDDNKLAAAFFGSSAAKENNLLNEFSGTGFQAEGVIGPEAGKLFDDGDVREFFAQANEERSLGEKSFELSKLGELLLKNFIANNANMRGGLKPEFCAGDGNKSDGGDKLKLLGACGEKGFESLNKEVAFLGIPFDGIDG
jgi:hypothetical protein